MMSESRKMTFKDLKNKVKPNVYYNFPNNFGEEGVDHLNIGIQSSTRLGKILDPGYIKVINYPYIGKFSSVLSLWFWLRSKDLDDNFRRFTGHKLKKYAESKEAFGNYVPNFKAIIGYATWLKVRNYGYILKDMKELPDNLKLLSYHIVKNSGLRVCTNYAGLIIDISQVIIDAVKNDEVPDFSLFVEDKTQAGMLYLEGFLRGFMPLERIEEMKRREESQVQEEVQEEVEVEDTGEDTQLELSEEANSV